MQAQRGEEGEKGSREEGGSHVGLEQFFQRARDLATRQPHSRDAAGALHACALPLPRVRDHIRLHLCGRLLDLAADTWTRVTRRFPQARSHCLLDAFLAGRDEEVGESRETRRQTGRDLRYAMRHTYCIPHRHAHLQLVGALLQHAVWKHAVEHVASDHLLRSVRKIEDFAQLVQCAVRHILVQRLSD